jgi:hypothetical protein
VYEKRSFYLRMKKKTSWKDEERKERSLKHKKVFSILFGERFFERFIGFSN